MKAVIEIIQDIVQHLFGIEIAVELTRPKPEFGDYATNLALQLAGRLNQNPRQIAESIAAELKKEQQFAEVNIAGPGFINIRLSDGALWQLAQSAPRAIHQQRCFVLEYSCPNAFKELHTGHLYQTIYGDMLARVLEATGARVNRTSFGGDVGLHVAKCLWGMRVKLGGELPDKLTQLSTDVFERAHWISEAYVLGAQAYEDDALAKDQIIELNKTIYAFHNNNDHQSPLAQIYWETRQWSFDYFAAFYRLIEVENQHYYPESSTAPVGLKVVKEQLEKGNLVESDGAVVFIGDPNKHLHTRVFVTSNGLPTYETKDIGVIWLEAADYNFDHRILITGNDQTEYMRVVYAAADVFHPGIGVKMTHLTNGTVRFSDGQKMSSRLGNVSRAADVIAAVKQRVATITNDPQLQSKVALGAIKYAFAKYRLGGDIAFDIEETVSLQGNSGPYLQYAHARACSILAKATAQSSDQLVCEADERRLLQKMTEFPEVVERAGREYMIHGICHYLYELAQEFNHFYEHNRVIGDQREAIRLKLVKKYRDILANGLNLLGIEAPEKM
ncbi:MAG: arginine--tRNA ligase [Candidatus Saccharibacteria bacterium]|nr:arginine--tRNA ligase [Candidatus Saccharibacteria bacterium]